MIIFLITIFFMMEVGELYASQAPLQKILNVKTEKIDSNFSFEGTGDKALPIDEKTASETLKNSVTRKQNFLIPLEEKISNILTEIDTISKGNERIFWNQVIEAHKNLDLDTLEKLQHEQPHTEYSQLNVLFFILSVIEQQNEKNIMSNQIVLSPMNTVKKSSFFKKITVSK